MQGGRARGVVLFNGDEYRAPCVVSGLDVNRAEATLATARALLPDVVLDAPVRGGQKPHHRANE